jgi:two-component system, NtrC family, sensor kinase
MFKFIDVKKWLFIILFFMPAATLFAQAGFIDSLKHEIEVTRNDTILYIELDALATAYLETKPDSSLYYSEKALEIARKLNLKLNEAFTLGKKAYAQQNKGNYPGSLRTFLSGIEIANDAENEKNILPPHFLAMNGYPPATTGHGLRLMTLGFLHEFTGILYENVNDYEKELYHLRFTKQYAEQQKDTVHMAELYYILGRVYLSLQKNDSAFLYEQKAYDLARHAGLDVSGSLLTLGKYYLAMGQDQQATAYLRGALKESQRIKYLRGEIASGLLLSGISRKQGKMDSSFYFTNTALALAQQMNSPDLLLRTWSELAEIYHSLHRYDSTAKYQALIIAMKDSLFNSKQAQLFHNIDFDEQQRQQEIEAVRKTYRERVQKYGLLAGVIVLFSIAIILWRNNRNKQKAYSLLKNQKQETDFQKSKVEQTLNELRATQAQLIQSEKMASLGELTAGIAHEIQNPLNFVNNFSEVNNELIEELKSKKSNPDGYREKNEGNNGESEILNDIFKNNEKISFHGKRADAIVKGMLQHSRTSSGQKELTDINKLTDEYLRLAYHGIRAKDKSFAAVPIAIGIKTDFDNSIEKINIVPQDIGRVILNLINNAFYAMGEKKKQLGDIYEPTVTVSTKKNNDKIEITVSDNGNGIPKKIADKIFQPFFTTKPTGQGTGLGLSLAYDIVKAHGGEIKVETKENVGSEFVLQLPLTPGIQ